MIQCQRWHPRIISRLLAKLPKSLRIVSTLSWSHIISLENITQFIAYLPSNFSDNAICIALSSCLLSSSLAYDLVLVYGNCEFLDIKSTFDISIEPGKYLDKYGRYEKMFQTKVVWFREGYMMESLIWPWPSFVSYVKITFNFLNENLIFHCSFL